MFTAPENRLVFNIAGHKFDEDISEILRFDPENMVEELIEHSSSFGYIAMLNVKVDAEVLELKKLRDRLHDELLLGLAEEKESRGRNFTVAMQEAVINQNASMIEASEKVEQIEIVSKHLKNVMSAYQQRKDMLSNAANWISRSETPPYVKPHPKEVVKAAKAKKVD